MNQAWQERRSIATLVSELFDESIELLRGELTLARIEIGGTVGTAGRGVAMIAAGVVLAMLGALSLFSGIVLLIGDQWLPRDLYWVGALIALILCGGVAALLVKRAWRALSPASLLPKNTIVSLKEDREWVRQQMTSAATSS